jgi:hypothetical protein
VKKLHILLMRFTYLDSDFFRYLLVFVYVCTVFKLVIQ